MRPSPSDLLKWLSSHPTLRACTEHQFRTSWLQDMAMGWRCRWVQRRTSRVLSLPGRVEVIRGEGAPTLVTVPFRPHGRDTPPRGVWPDQQTFWDDGSAAGGAVMYRPSRRHGPSPPRRPWASPPASTHQSLVFVPPSYGTARPWRIRLSLRSWPSAMTRASIRKYLSRLALRK